MIKVKRVVLRKWKIHSHSYFVSESLWFDEKDFGKRVKVFFEITEPKRKRRGTT